MCPASQICPVYTYLDIYIYTLTPKPRLRKPVAGQAKQQDKVGNVSMSCTRQMLQSDDMSKVKPDASFPPTSPKKLLPLFLFFSFLLPFILFPFPFPPCWGILVPPPLPTLLPPSPLTHARRGGVGCVDAQNSFRRRPLF